MNGLISYVLTTFPNEVAKIVVGAFGDSIEGFFASGVNEVQMAAVFTKLGDNVMGNPVTYTNWKEQDMVEGGLPIFLGMITKFKMNGLEAPIGGVLKATAARVLVKFPPVVIP